MLDHTCGFGSMMRGSLGSWKGEEQLTTKCFEHHLLLSHVVEEKSVFPLKKFQRRDVVPRPDTPILELAEVFDFAHVILIPTEKKKPSFCSFCFIAFFEN